MGRKTVDETLAKIEETQKALRDSIEESKELAAQSERLIRQYRDTIEPPE